MGAATDEFGLHSGPEHGKDHAKDHAAKEHSRAEGRCRQKEHHDRKKGPQFKVKYGLAARFIKAEKTALPPMPQTPRKTSVHVMPWAEKWATVSRKGSM